MKRNAHAGRARREGVEFRVLTDDDLADIHLGTLEVLERTGVFVEDEEAREIFSGAGATVDARGVVRIPAHVVEQAVRTAPSKLVLAGRNPKNDVVLEAGRVGFTNFGEGVQIVDPYTGELRVPTKQDVADTAKAVDALPNIDVYERAVVAEEVAQRALDAGLAPADIMQNGFVKGIQEVGELFESGEVFLPELMMSADAMAGATEVTNAALEGAAAEAKGVMVIGTVQGDVHDIGKAIVIAYLKANGYEVTDLGRDVSADSFIERAKELSADVIGMSALLTTTMEEQKKVIKRVKDEGLPFKTVVGGAPCTQRWADQIGADAYAEDANDGVKKIDALLGK